MNDKEIIGALVFVLYVTFKEVFPRLKRGNGHAKGDLERRVALLEADKEEVDKIRAWRHKAANVLAKLAADYETRTGREMDLP